jgi:hypothetical protein
MTIVRVKVLFFGMLRDIVGRTEEHIDLADGAQIYFPIVLNYPK